MRDLEGKKVAVAKVVVHLVCYMRRLKEGVNPSKVEVIQLQPDEAQPAFENGSVDAWATWEPFVSYQTVGNGATPLVKGIEVGTYGSMFTIARTAFTEENPELEKFIYKYIKKQLNGCKITQKKQYNFVLKRH